MQVETTEKLGLLARIVRVFLTSRLSIMLILFSLAVGVASVLVTPREEEPQIVVPMADIVVNVPGASAKEVERLVATPLERLLWQIDGVEYVYSMARRDSALVTVRFFVGENREDSLIKLHNAITKNLHLAPRVAANWFIRPVEIDDVPIVLLTFHSDRYNDHELRRIAEEMYSRLAETEDVSRVTVTGGRPREIRVELQPELLAGYGLSPLAVDRILQGADASTTAGTFEQGNANVRVLSNSFFLSPKEVGDMVIKVVDGRPVYLRDIATIHDGPAGRSNYTRFSWSNRALKEDASRTPGSHPAVTLALSKKKGTNAVTVAENIITRTEELKRKYLPAGVEVTVTRNYGATAQAKVNDLLGSLVFAIITVVALLAITLGWREAMIVALAVPVSFSLALFVNYLLGYTINRVTLFALILSLGLVVDDPITNVDNIQRHILMRKRKPLAATLSAVSEVLPPVIMSTLAIIICFVPLFFISGMMGPYMAPMAANVPLTVTFSTLCALTIVPWMAYHLLKGQVATPLTTSAAKQGNSSGEHPTLRRIYEGMLTPFLNSKTMRWGMLGVIILLLIGSASLAMFRLAPLKMLPFDNKNELQIVLDMPEGTTLETTDRAIRDFETYLSGVPEVDNWITFSGTSSPMDFNGMVRHYYLRDLPHAADIRLNLADKARRSMQSHGIALRLRPDLEKIAARHNANMKIVESPPGPPVISTVTAEVYGAPELPYRNILNGAQQLAGVMREEPFVVDVDTTMEAPHMMVDYVLDKEKASLHGVSPQEVTETLALALSGSNPALVHEPDERNPLRVRLILPRVDRSSIAGLSQIMVQGPNGASVPLAELGTFTEKSEDQPVYHKNLRRVAYVTAEMAGRAPGEAILDMQSRLKDEPLPPGVEVDWAGEGEWKITLDVFRDLGIAFAVALIGIYVLMVIETNSFFMPLLIMSAIPLTLLGIMPGFWLLNLVSNRPIGFFDDPVFFTATSMIGMIALGGIVIRNAIVLIDFIRDALEQGAPLREAIIKSGTIRLRPIVLTAMTTALGAWPITLDPIFSGLAWALIFGLAASTFFTLLVIPVSYYALYRKAGAS